MSRARVPIAVVFTVALSTVVAFSGVSCGGAADVPAGRAPVPAPVPVPAATADAAAEVCAGHAPMPDAVVEVLEQALAARKPRAEWDAAQFEASRAALASLRRAPLPDPTRMQRVRIVNGPGWAVPGWRAGDSVPVADLDLAFVGGPAPGSVPVEAIDFGAELDEVLGILRAERDGRPVLEAGPLTGAKTFRGGGPNTGLLQRAIWAAWIGRAADARTIADAALATGADVVLQLHARETGRWFARGVRLLASGAPRTDVLAVWEAAAPWAHEVPGSVRLREIARDLRAQVDTERARPLVDAAHPGALPVAERAAYFVARFVDLEGGSVLRGHWSIVDAGPGTRWSDEVVRLGRGAAPVLLAALDDRRLTRAPFGAECDFLGNDIQRVQDVALACLVSLSNGEGPRGDGALSQLDPEKRAAAIAEIRTWWEEHGDESELERRLARLDVPDVENLRRIEEIDRRAVDAVAVLRRWGASADGDALVRIAAELGRRGDVSLRPRVREVAAKRRTYETLWYFVAHGDATDIRALAATQRAGRRRNARSGDEIPTWPEIGRAAAAPGVRRPAVVPLLVDVLAAREMSGSRWVKGAPSIEYCAADEAIEALVALTGHDCGYDPAAAAADRFAAIDRWLAWWEGGAAAEFAAAHPDIADLVVPQELPTVVIERALAQALVVVRSPSLASVRWDVPRDDVRRLVASRAVTAHVAPDGAAEFSFASAAAESGWFAVARRAADGAVPSMAVQLADAWIDSRGRVLGFEHHGDSVVRRFDGRWSEVARSDAASSWDHALPDEVIAGADGAVLIVEDEGALHLLDDDGHVRAPDFASLAKAHGDRLRRAFRGVVVHRPVYRALLVVDSRDRVWWRDSRVPGVAVLDGTSVVEGPLPVLRKADPPHDRRCDAMAPADHGGVAVFTSASSGALLDVTDGAIVVVAMLDVPGLHSTPHEVIAMPDGGLFLDGRRFDTGKRGWAAGSRALLAAVAPDGTRWIVSDWNSSNRSTLRHVAADGRERVWAMAGDDGAVDVEPDGVGTAWVSSRTALRHVRIDGDRLVETLRIPLPDGERGLRPAGPGRVWVLGSAGDGTSVRARLVMAGE